MSGFGCRLPCGERNRSGVQRALRYRPGLGRSRPESRLRRRIWGGGGGGVQAAFPLRANDFPGPISGSEAETREVEGGRAAGRMVLDMRTDDGSEPMELNYDLGRYERRNDSLRLAPGTPPYGVTPVPAFAGFDRSPLAVGTQSEPENRVHSEWTPACKQSPGSGGRVSDGSGAAGRSERHDGVNRTKLNPDRDRCREVSRWFSIKVSAA